MAVVEAIIENKAPTRGEPVSRFERREAQIARILDAARTCFLRSGFHGASMGEVCAAAGMSPGALYRYFPSKEALVEALCASDKEADAKILASIAEAPSIIDGMTFGLLAHTDQVHRSGMAPLLAEIFAEAMRNPALNEMLERQMDEVHAVISDAIQRAISRGEINPALPVDKLLPIMMAMGEGLVTRDLPSQGIAVSDMEPLLRGMIIGILRPIEKTANKPAKPKVRNLSDT
jgi:TetR/AcrR family transcriptional regulator, repressor for uid operon